MRTIILLLGLINILDANAQGAKDRGLDSIAFLSSEIRSKLNYNMVFDSAYTKEMLENVAQLKEFSDDIYFTYLQHYSTIEPNKKKRIRALKELTFYPYYKIKYNDEILKRAKYIYSMALWKLIHEYEGDLEALNSLKVDPGAQEVIYPQLKNAIERAGGKWTRGDYEGLNPDIISGEITNASENDSCSNGSINLLINEGIPPFKVEWRRVSNIDLKPASFTLIKYSTGIMGPNEGEDISGLNAGAYEVEVTDAQCGYATKRFVINCNRSDE